MSLHHGADHFWRKRKEALRNRAPQHARILHQINELLEQTRGAVRDPSNRLCCAVDGGLDQLGPRVAIHQHTQGRQGVRIALGIRDLHRSIAMQPMTTSEPIAADTGISALQLDGDQIRSQQGHEPADRSTEALATGPPAHETPPLQGIDPGWNQALEQIATGLTGRSHRGEHAGAFRGLPHLEFAGFHAAATGESDRSRTGLPIHEGLGHWGALAILREIVLTSLQIGHTDGQTPGRATDTDALMAEATLTEISGDALQQLLQGKTGEIRGQLLGANLQKKG